MIDWIPVLFGLFFLVCVTQNRADWTKKEYSDIYLFFSGGPFILVSTLMGLGFIYPSSRSTFPNHGLLWPSLIACACATAFAKGPIKVISRIAWVSIMAYIIMGSFM